MVSPNAIDDSSPSVSLEGLAQARFTRYPHVPAACRLPPARRSPCRLRDASEMQCSCLARPPATHQPAAAALHRAQHLDARVAQAGLDSMAHVMQIAAAQSTVHPVCAQAYAAHPCRLVCSSAPSFPHKVAAAGTSLFRLPSARLCRNEQVQPHAEFAASLIQSSVAAVLQQRAMQPPPP